MQNALEGIKVVDFGDWLAGPYATRLMADLGASVIKIEPPGGLTIRPQNRSFAGHRTLNYIVRGQRDVVLDLKQPEGVEAAHRLIAEADIVAQNMRVGVADRIGIGYEEVKRINPRVIYVFSPGFGALGPRSRQPSFEPLNSAFAGIHYRSGGKGNPPAQGISLDAYCGVMAACGAMMALLHRQKTGEGQYLDVSQLACAMYYTSETYRKADGELGPLPELDNEQAGFDPLDRLYRTNDYWIAICCPKESQWLVLCEALGQPSLATDPRFRTNADRTANGETLTELLAERFTTNSAHAWQDMLDRAGVPCEVPVKDGQAAFLQNQAYVDSGMVVEYPHPWWGLMREIGHILNFSETPGEIRGPAPQLGEHTVQVLGEAGYSETEIREMLEKGAAFAAEI
jgi:crotonobetainyl-CoA:carnitine CoA-transferase CaiB-like acyl-CoA transferase